MTKKILIADDEPEIRRMLESFFKLKFTNYKTLTAKNGKIALNIARQNSSDLALILMDTDMPELQGNDVCKTLRDEGYEIPIIGMSGRDNREKWEEAGADNYLKKSFTLNTLLTTVKTYLRE